MELSATPTADQELAALGRRLLEECAQTECPVEHYFSDGCYFRKVLMPAGTFVMGCKHKTRHLNILFSGHCRVMMDGEIQELDAREKPVIFESHPGVRKILHILEATEWATIHVTGERDLEKLGLLLIENPDDHWLHLAQVEAQKLKNHGH